MTEKRNNNVKIFMTIAVGLMLAFSIVSVLPAVTAQVPPLIELRAGQGVTSLGDVVLDDGITPVPVGCLVQVRNSSNMNEIFDWFYMGEGTNAPVPPLVPLEGSFDVWPTVPFGATITLRAFNAPTEAGASLWGDSISMPIIPAVQTYDFPGWSLGITQAPTSSSTANATGNITLTTMGLPIINNYDLRNSSNNLSVLNMQLDLDEEYYFLLNTTDLSGVNNISTVTIRAWYDGGLVEDPNGYGNGVPNTEFAFQYNWQLATYNLTSTYTEADPEIRNVWGPPPILWDMDTSNPEMDTFELRFYFTLGEQIRHAPGDGVFDNPPTGEFNGTTTAAFNDLNSWNFDMAVMNNNGFGAYAYDEFGVYQYTRISAGDISAEGLPGQVVAFPLLEVNYSSNDAYNLGVYVNTPLTKTWPMTTPASTIGENYINVSGGWLVKTSFTGLGYANAEYFYASHAAPDWGTGTTMWAQFWVYIPLNILGGHYEGDLVYFIEQV